MNGLNSAPRFYMWTHPNRSWMENFAQNLLSPDIVMWGEESETIPAWYAWTSRHFDEASTPQEFLDKMTAMKAMFDGAMYLASGRNYYPLELVNPSAENVQDQEIVCDLPYPGNVTINPFSPKHLKTHHGLDQSKLDDPLTRNIFLARYDEVAFAILKYVGVNGITYQSLYAFRDWMKDAGWDDKKIADEAGWSGSRLKDFTNTANNPAYLGPFARHGGSKDPPPKRPMLLDEAEKGLLQAVNRFLLHRAATVDLRAEWNALR
ncbi:hypothetical protein GCM10023115_00410 [Pontixanthobacter gangjinensis]|uniref:Uncharacterized protein n=1 Tax=Pontixanthobacter gangjinensis TaxID=1028742 RepID=A0A6I4SI99_9SPHN|nr:hypothetical protein [Pontixanthobacter gangjinensis]MXO55295.1 hypothetical protein [Pontixanthobacter gangjinensis]